MLYQDLNEFNAAIEPYKPLLGLDFGGAKIGIAASDRTRMIASPRELYKRKGIKNDVAAIWAIIAELDASGIILGYPVEMDGNEGKSCQKVVAFAEAILKEQDIPIFLQDERLSTAAVNRAMMDAGLNRKKRAEKDDELSATYILQGVIDRL